MMSYLKVREKLLKEAASEPTLPVTKPEAPRPLGLASPRNTPVTPTAEYEPLTFTRNAFRGVIEARQRAQEKMAKLSQQSTSKGALGSFVEGATKTQEKPVSEAPVDSETPSEGMSVTSSTRSPGEATRKGSSGAAGSILALMDKHEGGGDYNALLGFSNRSDFKGIRVSEMTLDQLSNFSRGEYAQWSKNWKSKNRHGDSSIPSTPMGRYQFVGSTLRSVAKEMGLAGDTVFTPEVQDRMFEFYAKKRMAGSNSIEGKRQALRNAWEGFERVSNSALDSAIRNMS